MPVEKLVFKPTYTRENGLFVIDLDEVKDLPFAIKERSLVSVPPKAIGGNHKHPRWEAFVGLGEGLQLVWQDETGQNQEEKMNPEGNLFIFIISPYTPHAVVNTSTTCPVNLVEFASEAQREVETVNLV